MAGSSPAGRKSLQWTSPARLSSFLGEPRNTELSHKDALDAALVEHEKVRDAALHAIHLHELKQETLRLEDEQRRLAEERKKEEKRLEWEQAVRAEQERVKAAKAKSIPQLPPDSPKKPPTVVPQPSAQQQAPVTKPAPVNAVPQPEQANGNIQPRIAQPTQPQALPQVTTAPPQPIQASRPPPQVTQTNGAAKTPLAPQAAPVVAPRAQPQPESDRYREIHRDLKKLRAFVTEQCKSNPVLKSSMGDMRRLIRKNVGQLVSTGDKGKNKIQLDSIKSALRESLNGKVPSAAIDPAMFVADKREPSPEAAYNDQLPCLFIYLLNQLAKAVLNQFINECGASPKSAEPIGILTMQIFSSDEFSWRGKSLIDILMAKFRVVCPVVFGFRGSEKTEQGRARLGWWREGDGWISEQQHIDRMMGLGAGYASIALRDFSRSKNVNPWPPSKYWASMATIVNTPGGDVSNTQCVVLKAMITLYEDKFFNFYGTAAIAALRKALVDFPASATAKTPGVAGLEVLAQLYQRDFGLTF